MEERDDLAVRQSNALAKSAQRMELNEKRLVLMAMSQIKREDTEFLVRDIAISEFSQYLGGNPYQEAKKAADGLLERVVYIQSGDGAYKKFQWTTLSEYIPAKRHPEGRACIRVRLNEELKPLLLQLKDRFNSIPLAELMPIPSFNSQRLYEVLWADSFAGQKQFLSYEIEALKVLLGLRDTEGRWEKYKDWRDFKKVLVRAQQDFETYGALRIDAYKGLREGRSFDKVLFTLSLLNASRDGPPFKAVSASRSPEERLLAQQLGEAGYLQDAYEAIDIYGAALVEKTLAMAREAERKAAQTSKPVYNLGGLISSMLKNRVAERRSEVAAHKSEADLRRVASSLAFAFAGGQSEYAADYWDTLSTEEQENLHDLMRVDLEPMLLKLIEDDNWQGPAYMSTRNSYLLERFVPGLPPHLATLAAFVTREALLQEFDHKERARILELANVEVER